MKKSNPVWRKVTESEYEVLPHVTWIFHPGVSTKWAFYLKEPGEDLDRLVCWHAKGRHADVDRHIVLALVAAGHLPRRFMYESYHAFSHQLAAWPATEHLLHAGPSAGGPSIWDADDHDPGFPHYLEGLTFPSPPRYASTAAEI